MMQRIPIWVLLLPLLAGCSYSLTHIKPNETSSTEWSEAQDPGTYAVPTRERETRGALTPIKQAIVAANRPAFVAVNERAIVAVMEIEDRSRRFSTTDIRAATDYLRGRLTETGRFIVIDETRQAAALTQLVTETKKASYKQCRARECQVPLGQALSADSILRTTIIHLGGVFSLQAEFIDLSKEAAIKGATVDFTRAHKKTEAHALVGALKDLVQELSDSP